MKTTWLVLIPIVVTLLIVSLVPYPSSLVAREISVNLRLKVSGAGDLSISIHSNYTKPGYWLHVNDFWAGTAKNNRPPANYSWFLEVKKDNLKPLSKTPIWTAHYYWPYDLDTSYLLNVTYSFAGQVNDHYTFVVGLHYDFLGQSGYVNGANRTASLVVSA